MRATVGGSGGDFPILDEGGYPARVYGVVDIGLHEGKYGEKHQCVLLWELPDEKGDDGRPYGISKFYTLSLNEKANLRKDIESMKGKIPPEKLDSQEFIDGLFQKIIGTPCNLSISQYKNAEGYLRNGIETVGKLTKGTKLADMVNSPILLDLDNFDSAVYRDLPEWLKKKVDEGKARFDAQNINKSSDDTDDIPFEGNDDDDAEW